MKASTAIFVAILLSGCAGDFEDPDKVRCLKRGGEWVIVKDSDLLIPYTVNNTLLLYMIPQSHGECVARTKKNPASG